MVKLVRCLIWEWQILVTTDQTSDISCQSCKPEFTTHTKATAKYNVRYVSIVAIGTLAFYLLGEVHFHFGYAVR